ncbi:MULTISPECIES: hypothetical protein [Microbacterium]|uniref:hypothetical protein n=1 Tax=Microbacterium TaxID=33882 RepID=UPI00344DE7D8
MRRASTFLTLATTALVATGSLTACSAMEIVATSEKPAATPEAPESAGAPGPNAPDWEGLPSTPVSPAEYADTYMQANPHHMLHRNLDGILEYYRDAATAFPFPLPAGYSFPVDPGYYDRPQDGPNWAEVVTANRIWSYFEYANVDAARAAFDRGDEDAALGYLDVIRDAYLSDAFPNNYEGTSPQDWYDGVYSGMREGDFTLQENFIFNPFPWEPGQS